MSLGRKYRSPRTKALRQSRARQPEDETQDEVDLLRDKHYDWEDLDRELSGYANFLDDKIRQLTAVSSGNDWREFAADICSGGEMTVILQACRLALSVIEREPGPTYAERKAMALARRVLFTGGVVVSLVEGFSPTAVLIALGFRALDFYLARQKEKLDTEMHESLATTHDARKQIRKLQERLVRLINRL